MKKPVTMIAGALALGVVGWLAYELFNTPSMPSHPRSSAMSLMTIATAQADFRSNDRDGNGKNDFWRGDIAGLYALKGKDGEAIKLIEVSMAGADAHPVTDIGKLIPPGPKAGYRCRALRFADEKSPDPDRFAACAFPDNEMAGKNMYIVSHDNLMFKKKAVPGGIEVYPSDPLREGWEKVD